MVETLLFIAQTLFVIALVIGVVAVWWWFPRWQLRKFYAGIAPAHTLEGAPGVTGGTLSP